jgi:endothelin-converting enzyme
MTSPPLLCPLYIADLAESAPLLQSSDRSSSGTDRNFFSALTHPTRQLTNLEKVLAAAGVALLILAGTFIGLFTGAEVALGKERAKGGGKTEWRTATETRTVGGATTVTATTTAPGSTVTAVPTGKPAVVRSDPCDGRAMR